MISKGTTHNNGPRLASYLTTGKNGERAEFWQLRGFEATNIRDAFRDVQIMAGATQCEQPFFHVQVRNREGETLTRYQWEEAADRIERMLGLKNQPRAIAFHIDEKSGHEHMHVAWSRIDQENLKALPLPFFKSRLKKISRELEAHFALEPVTNRRPDTIKYAPTRAEEEQARRLGFDIHEIRSAIRSCYERSDCGTSFQAALASEGMILAKGERRDFVVIDREGGMHALGKRILDDTAAKIRSRFSDLARDNLPSVDQARVLMLERGVQEDRKALRREKPEPLWDRDQDERKWQDAVVNAAIEKEKIERTFVEPEKRQTPVGSRKKERALRSGLPQAERVSPAKRFAEVARETSRGSKPKTKGRAARATIHVATTTVGKALDVAADAFASLFAPATTPQQQHEINMTARKREAEAEDAIDFSNYTAELARQRQRDQEREFQRAKERERER